MLFREVGEPYLAPEAFVGWASVVELGFAGLFAHPQARVLAGFLEVEEAGEDGRVAFGGPAAGVVQSGVAGDAVRQEAVVAVSQAHGEGFTTWGRPGVYHNGTAGNRDVWRPQMDVAVPIIVLILAIVIPFAFMVQSLMELTFGTDFSKEEAADTSGVRKDDDR